MVCEVEVEERIQIY